MIRESAVCSLILIACAGPTLVVAQQRGETVVANKRTKLTSAGKGLTIAPGEALIVKEVKGDRLLVSSVRTGWIRRADISKPQIAREMFRGQIDQKPVSADPYLGRAGAWQCLFNFDNAVQDYEQAIRLDPKNSEAYAKRGECWLAKGLADKAWLDFTEALAINPDDPRSLSGRAVVLMQRSQLEPARRDVEKALRLAPDYSDAYAIRASVEQQNREFDKAIGDFSKAIELRGSDPNLFLERGDAWFASGNYDRALDDYTAAIHILPHEIYRRHRANARCATGKFDLAINDLKAAIGSDPSDSETLNGLAWLQATAPDHTLRDGPAALKYATKACELTDWERSHLPRHTCGGLRRKWRFRSCRGTSKKASMLAPPNQKAEFEVRLQLYRSRKPYREKNTRPHGSENTQKGNQ